jgi:hypothetical protein
MTEPRYIRFVPRGVVPGKVTQAWEVENRRSGDRLGLIGWYGPWRRYAFMPTGSTLVFDEICLRDIAAFLEEQTRQQRAKRGAA